MQSLRDTASQMWQAQYEALRSRLVELSKPLNENSASVDGGKDDGLRLVSNFESSLVELQSLLIWEKPYRTANALTLFTFLYWTLAMFNLRLVAVLASLMFCYHFYEMWTRFVWPEIRVENAEVKEEWTPMNPNVLSAPEIERYLEELRSATRQFVARVCRYRSASPGAFCVCTTLIFITVYVISRTIPGVLLVYCFTILLFLAPGIVFYVLPLEMHQQVIDFFTKHHSLDTIDGASDGVRSSSVTCPSTRPPSATTTTTTTGSSKSSSSSQLSTLVENFFASSSSSEQQAARVTTPKQSSSRSSASASRKTSADSSLDLDEFELIEETDFVN